MSCMTYKLRHVVCTWQSQILRKKNITRIRNGRKRICIFMHSNGFLAVKITKFHFFHFLMVFTKPGHLKIMQHYDVVHDV